MDIETRMQTLENKLDDAIKKIDDVPTLAEMDLANEKLAKRIAVEVLACVSKDYATKLALEKIKSRINWYAWITPVLTGAVGAMAAYIMFR